VRALLGPGDTLGVPLMKPLDASAAAAVRTGGEAAAAATASKKSAQIARASGEWEDGSVTEKIPNIIPRIVVPVRNKIRSACCVVHLNIARKFILPFFGVFPNIPRCDSLHVTILVHVPCDNTHR